jgi:antitoxin VapB
MSKTEAVKLALVNELHREEQRLPFLERVKAIQDRLAAYPRTSLEADKAFYDSLNDE